MRKLIFAVFAFVLLTGSAEAGVYRHAAKPAAKGGAKAVKYFAKKSAHAVKAVVD